MAEERNDPGGTEAVVAALVAERANLVLYGKDDRVAEVDKELAARGYDPKKAEKAAQADLDKAEAERQRVHKEADEAAKARAAAGAKTEPPQDRSVKPTSKT